MIGANDLSLLAGWDDSTYTDKNWNILAEVIRTTTSLETLCFEKDAVIALQNDEVADALAKNCTIKELVLRKGCSDAEAKAVSAILKRNSTMEIVKLYNNNISGEGAKVIAEALKHNKALRHIDLDDNHIGVEGAKVIAKALKQNACLQTLRFSGNQIGVAGAKAIADALKENTSLHRIDLDSNKIGYEGAKAIVDALKENTSLQELFIGGNNNIGEKGGNDILNALQQIDTSAIENIDLDWNQVSSRTKKRINQEMTRIQNRFKGVGSNEGQVAAEDGEIQGDENASSSNEDERLPSIHATNASQVDGQQSNETEHDTNTTVTETKINQGDGSAEINQESNETETDVTVAQEDKEIATVMMGQSQTMQEMLYIIDSTDALRTEDVATLANARGIEIVGRGSPAYTDENWNILAEEHNLTQPPWHQQQSKSTTHYSTARNTVTMPSMMRLTSTYQRATELKPGDIIVSVNGTNLILDKGKQEIIDKQSQAVELAAEKTEAATKTQQQHTQYHHHQQQAVIQQNYQQQQEEKQRELEEHGKLQEQKKLQQQTGALERVQGENGTKKEEPPGSSDCGRIKSTSDLFRRQLIQQKSSLLKGSKGRSRIITTDALSKRHEDLLKAIISHQTEFYKFHRGKKNEAGKIARAIRDKLKKDDRQKEKEADQEERASFAHKAASLLEDTQQRAVELAAKRKKIIPVATASDVIKISHRDVSKLPVVFGFHLDDKGSRSLATAAATAWRNGGKKAAKSVYLAKISLHHHNSSSNTSTPSGSSSNGDEGLTTIHTTNASQGDGNTESDKESNEARHNTIAVMTKIKELQSTIAQQQAELAQKDKEITEVMMERSETTRKMSELQLAIAQQQAELAQKDGDIAQRDKEIASVMMERSQTTRQLAEQQSTIAQLRGDLAQKHEDLRSLRLWSFNGLDAGSEIILENYTKCCVCLEPYDEDSNLPIKSATCAHSLCEECLNDYHASLMNGRSTLRYVRCPQCNDKSKRAFDIQNKVVDSFLREYIQCRKGKRKYHTTLQSESDSSRYKKEIGSLKGQLTKQAQQMVEVEEDATKRFTVSEAHVGEAHREKSQQPQPQPQQQHKQSVQIDGNERSKRGRLASSLIDTKKQRERETDEVEKLLSPKRSLHPEVIIGDMDCQMHYDDGNSMYVGPLDGLPLLTSPLQKESRYLHSSQKLLLAQLEIFKISPKLMEGANSESLGLRCQNCVTEKNGCCFMKLSSSNNLVRDLFLFGKEHVVRCVTKAKVKKQIHDALLLLGRSADELSNYCTLIANLYGLEDKKSADGRINVVLGQSPTLPAGYSFPTDIDVRGILRASSAEANNDPDAKKAHNEGEEDDDDAATNLEVRNQEKHWMAMWKDAKDELKKLREEMRNEPDDEVRAELAHDTEELNAWIEYHK